jgi:OOP family OmpA-OmpF porin
MKKFLSLCAVLSLFSCEQLDAYDDVGYMTFKYGLTTIEDDFSFDQHSFGVDFIGEIGYQLKPKLDFTYVSIDKANSVDSLFQTSVNAFFKSSYGYQNIIPYFYGGLGYEYVSGARKDFDSSFYIQEGIGIEIPISEPADELHIVTELKLMQMIGSGDGQDSEASIFIGLRLPIGKSFSTYNSGTISRPRKASRNYAELQEDELPSPEIDVQEPTAIGDNVKANRDFYPDEDGDGVPDGADVCPGTPSETAVNSSGCPIRDENLYIEKPKRVLNRVAPAFRKLPITRKILDVHFKLNSDQVTDTSRKVIREFVEYINSTNFSKVIVEGYTDGTGIYEKNLALSKRRAQAVKKLMIQYGIDSDKIIAIGKGSINPIASDDTEKGRALNRRIEIIVE